MPNLPTIQKAWQLAPIISTRVPEIGTIHQTLLITTTTAAYALRSYRFTEQERWRIEYEHEIIRYAVTQGLPALLPLALAETDETIFFYQDHFYSLFPFATGYQVKRGRLTEAELTELGSFLGRLHEGLHDYPQSRVQQRILSVDSEKTLTKIVDIETVIRAKTKLDDVDQLALQHLDQQRTWIEQNRVVSGPLDFTGLEQQVIHGDYQEANIFFTREPETGQVEVSAIIDWDQAYYGPRAWEIVRTFDYTCELEPAACALTLAGYRTRQILSQEELDLMAKAYGLLSGHNIWIYEEFYLRENERVRRYFQKDYMPFAVKWERLQKSLYI